MFFPTLTFANSTSTWTIKQIYESPYIFDDINRESFNNNNLPLIQKPYLDNWQIKYLYIPDYYHDLKDIKIMLYQITLIVFWVWFFFLSWIFYSFLNDLLWKK